jgi:pimeloyl-ACP methyl ester carboxylesterase
MTSHIASVPKIMIPNAGHALMTDNPARFYRELLGVLKINSYLDPLLEV